LKIPSRKLLFLLGLLSTVLTWRGGRGGKQAVGDPSQLNLGGSSFRPGKLSRYKETIKARRRGKKGRRETTETKMEGGPVLILEIITE